MQDRHLAHLRLVSQRIIASRFSRPDDVVRSMLAVQAQDFAASKWAIGLRAPGSTVTDVDAALGEGTIVRSWPMRGTLHITAAEDLPWMLGLTASKTIASATKRHADLGLDERTFERARMVAQRALSGGNALARGPLLAEFQKHGIETSGQRGYHILWRLAHDGTICLGPFAGTQQAFVLLDEWVKHPLRFEREEALGELARRYFVGHGPATERDLAWWAKLTLKDVRTGIAIARSHLAEFAVGGATYFMASDAESQLDAARKAVIGSLALLPAFDEYLLGYTDRSAVLAPEFSQAIVPGGNGIFASTIVLDGQITGTWRWTSRKAAALKAQAFANLAPTARKKLQRAVRGYAHFVGTPLEVAVVATAG